MNTARKKPLSKVPTTKETEVVVIDSSNDDISSESQFKASFSCSWSSSFHANKLKNKQKKRKGKPHETESISFGDIYSNSKTFRDENSPKIYKKRNDLLYTQVLVKNPDFTNQKKLAKDQCTLDTFITDFKQSKYLKANKIISKEYKQLSIFDFKKKQKKQEKV